jgi:hypothetical protein
MMQGRIAGDEREAVGQLEPAAPLQGTCGSNPAGTDRCLVNQLQGQSGLDPLGRLPRPSAQKIPGTQPQMFSDQQPDAGEVSRDLIR